MASSPELDILTRTLQHERMSPDAARYILSTGFRPDDTARMNELAARARAGALTPEEDAEARWYDTIGHVLIILHTTARRALHSPA